MCGIAGFLNCNKERIDWDHKIKLMCNEIIARGPDDYGTWHCEKTGLTLGHRRLSILDLSQNGHQPMVSHSERFIISYNGEIYNYSELHRELDKLGIPSKLKGYCDTELLLESFSLLGIESTLNLIRGMFAIALYDRELGKLYLIKDRMGEKPLAYGYVNEDFVFSSSLDAIRAYAGNDTLRISREGIFEFLYYGYISAPLSIYEGVYKLLPGEIVTVDIKTGKIIDKHLYWDIEKISKENKTERTKTIYTEEAAREKLEELLESAIEEQMVADVPIGAYLSGGVDSSLVVSIMRNLAGNKVNTFTIGIEGEASDESVWAMKVAKHLGVSHHTEYITKENMLQSVKRMPAIFDEPFADVSQVPTYMVSKLAKQYVTVTLSGDAGDELFCGYNHYWDYDRIWQNIQGTSKYGFKNYCLAKTVSKIFNGELGERAYEFANKCKASSIEELYRIIPKGKWAENAIIGYKAHRIKNNQTRLWSYTNSNLSNLENLMLLDQMQYLPEDILVKVDRTGMAVSLENRIPLLDKRIVEFAWTIPESFKYSDGTTKKIMRDILYKYVPKELIERPKQGFSFPATRWIVENKEMRQWVEALFESKVLQNAEILNKNTPIKMWKKHISGENAGHILWNYIMLLAWADYRGQKL